MPKAGDSACVERNHRARRVHNGSDLHGTFSLRLNKAAQQSAQAFVRPWR